MFDLVVVVLALVVAACAVCARREVDRAARALSQGAVERPSEARQRGRG